MFSLMILYTGVERKLTGCSAVGSARGLGPWGREFESLHPDHFFNANHTNGF